MSLWIPEGADPTRIGMAIDPRQARMRGVTAHRNIEFDVPFMTEIADNLWQGGCRDGLLLPDTIKHVVSLYPWEQYSVRHDLDSSLTVRMYDSLDQDASQVDAIAAWVNMCRKTGPVLVHCQAGLNRSSLVAATALIQDGMTPDEAITTIRTKRSRACLCNAAFERWLRDKE